MMEWKIYFECNFHLQLTLMHKLHSCNNRMEERERRMKEGRKEERKKVERERERRFQTIAMNYINIYNTAQNDHSFVTHSNLNSSPSSSISLFLSSFLSFLFFLSLSLCFFSSVELQKSFTERERGRGKREIEERERERTCS